MNSFVSLLSSPVHYYLQLYAVQEKQKMRGDVGVALLKSTLTRKKGGYNSEGKYTKPHPSLHLLSDKVKIAVDMGL